MDRVPWLRRRAERTGRAPGDPYGRMFNVRNLPAWIYRGSILVLAFWMLQSFVTALLAASVTAVASWPLYTRFAYRMPRHFRASVTAGIFTALMTVFVLAPMTYAFVSLLNEAHTLILEVGAADQRGIEAPSWLRDVPLLGPLAAARWQRELGYPGAILKWTQRTDAAEVLAWAQSLGRFMMHHLFIILFTILVLFFLYHEGESLARQLKRMLREAIGDSAGGYLEVATQALRASVNSMLVVSLFVGFACGITYAIAGVPKPGVWAAITGALALVPFLGYVAVLALTLQLALAGATTAAVVSFTLGCLILLFGDKVVRPMAARDGMRLGFVWVLMGCLGGFEALGLVGLVIGPVVLALARELWDQRTRELALQNAADESAGVRRLG